MKIKCISLQWIEELSLRLKIELKFSIFSPNLAFCKTSTKEEDNEILSFFARKPVIGVSDQVPHKTVCAVTKES